MLSIIYLSLSIYLQAWALLGVCMDALGQADAALNCRREVLRIKMGP